MMLRTMARPCGATRGVLLGAVCAMALALAMAGAAAADTSRRVQFQSGADGADLAARVEGYETASFVVGARAGQTLIVEMETSNLSAYFNVTAPGATEAMHIGSVAGERFEGVLPVTGDYLIEAYLMRNAARRNEAADVRLSIRIPAGGAPVAPAGGDFADGLAGGPDFWEVANLSSGASLNVRNAPSTDGRIRGHLATGDVVRNLGCAMVDDERWCEVAQDAAGLSGWVSGRYLREGAAPVLAEAGQIAAPAGGPVAANGQPFDATGIIPCARDLGQPTTACAFGVQRRGAGSADVFVAFPGGGQRLISFSEGEPRAADTSEAISLGREADLWFVRIGTERYEIPDAVVFGG